MPNPFAPILGFLGVAAAGGSKKRRRKKKQSDANGTPTQRTGNRALDIIRIQRGLPRDQEPSSETADEVAASPLTAQRRRAGPQNGVGPPRDDASPVPPDAPRIRISKAIGNDTIGLTTDGKRGFVGAQWWSRSGRNMLAQIRRRHPSATPEEATALLLKQAVPSVDWEPEEGHELPRGAQMLGRRLRRLVEAGYMGREVQVETPPVHPQETLPPNAGASPEAPVGPAPGMPVAQPRPVPPDLGAAPPRPVPQGIEIQPEPAAEGGQEAETVTADKPDAGPAGAAQEGSEDAQPSKTRRGGRGRGGKKERKAAAAAAEAEAAEAAEAAKTPESTAETPEEAAHDTPEGDGSGATGNSDGSDTDPDAPSSQ